MSYKGFMVLKTIDDNNEETGERFVRFLGSWTDDEKLKARHDYPEIKDLPEQAQTVKKNLTENKPVKKTRSIHADTHSGANDRLSHIIFGQDENGNLDDLVSTELVPVRTDSKGKLSISVKIEFENMPELKLPQSLADPYNRAILDSVTSLYLAGNSYFTTEMVYREMTGYEREVKPDRKALQEINQAINILRKSLIIIDATNEAKAKGYKFRKTQFSDNLLHVSGLHTVDMNGQQVDAYGLLAEPVLYSYAKQKGQIITCDIAMLALPEKVNMTRDNVILQHYLIERIEGMKNSKNKLGQVILYESIYKTLGATEATRDEKYNIRQRVKELLDNWVGLAYIKGYQEEKQGKLIRSILIDLYETENRKMLKS